MKTFTLLLLASLLVINNLFAQEPQESPELKEASALMQSVAKLFKDQKYDEALTQTKKALEIREKLLPQSDPLIANCLVYLGDIYLARNEFDAAKKVLERSLAIQIERSSPDDVNLTPTMDRLAQAYYGNREDRKAEDIIKRSLAAKEKALGGESSLVAESLMTLGQFYRAKKDFERATENYRRSLLIYGKVSGIASPEFDRATDEFYCVAAITDNKKLFEELQGIWRQFLPAHAPQEIFEAEDLRGKALVLPKPDYPPAARDRRLAGIVVVKVEIDETGKVISARDMCQGPPFLSESAVKSARGAVFKPTLFRGMPVKTKGAIRYKFVRL